MQTPAAKRMAKARIRLLTDQPWFGTLSMRLALNPDETGTVPYMCTDGNEIVYNADWVTKTTDGELRFTIAHEVMHCALLHPYRRGLRDPEKWNYATDYMVNLALQEAGFEIPDDAVIEKRYAGLSVDVIYAQLPDPPPGQKNQPGKGAVKDAPPEQKPPDKPEEQPGNAPGPGSGGQEQSDAADQPAQGMSEDQWKIAAEQATMVCKKAGKEPKGADRAVKAARESKEDWRATLRDFVAQQVPSDYTWSQPNRRHIAQGLYLPGIRKENVGRIVIGVDTSGSIDENALAIFGSEITAIAQEVRPEAVEVIYCDAAINGERQVFSPDDPEIKLEPRGGGGTSFKPVFKAVAKDAEPPLALLYFTDLDNGNEKIDPPDYPVLWVTGLRVTRKPPFGEVIRIDDLQMY